MSILVRKPGSELMRYGGYCSDVVAQNREAGRTDLMKSIKIAKSKGLGDPNWNKIHEQLVVTYNEISQPGAVFPQYKAHLLSAVICPYIAKMSQRKILAPTRYQQVSRIITLMGSPHGNEGSPQHPVHLLLEMDEVCREVAAEAGLWPSDLAAYLQGASTALWAPILTDLKTDTQSLAIKFLAVGLVDVVGKPLLLAYPLWLIVEQALKLVQAVEAPQDGGAPVTTAANALQNVNATVIMQVVKAVLLLFVVQKFIALLELFSGAGQVCLLVGVGLHAATLNTPMLKQLSPALVQHLGMLAGFLDRLGKAEQAMHRAVNGGGAPGASATAGLAPSDRVEEIPPAATSNVSAVASTERLPVAQPVPSTQADSSGASCSSAPEINQWSCSMCTFLNSSQALTQCEMCQSPRENTGLRSRKSKNI